MEKHGFNYTNIIQRTRRRLLENGGYTGTVAEQKALGMLHVAEFTPREVFDNGHQEGLVLEIREDNLHERLIRPLISP